VRLSRRLYDELVAHARRERPLEACGILSGVGEAFTRFYPCRNAEASPVRYRIDPLEILGVLRRIDAAGESLLGVFHSHPTTEAYPSETDRRLAFYPEALYLILSLAGPQPVLRGFWIRDGAVREEALAVEDG
jgi:proteasome lid subunit RPN8/RPN11